MIANEDADADIESRIDYLRESTSLSDQEAKIQAYREAGDTPSQIAERLDISRSQVSVALNRISEKQQEAEAMAAALRGEAQQAPREDGSILPETARPDNNPNIFLAPTVNDQAQRHFRHTVLDGVDVEDTRYRPHVPSRYSGTVAIWGTGEGNRSTAEAMTAGDVILFYVGDSTYSHYAVVQAVEHNPELAEALWTPYSDTLRKEEHENWPWVMYLSDPVAVDIDSERLHDTLGWSQSYPLGFTRIADHRVTRLKNEHGGIHQYLEEALVQRAVESDDEVPTLDMSVDPDPAPAGVDEADADETSDDPDLETLRERAEAQAQETATETTTTTTRYQRSGAVKEYVLARADGVCEACEQPAPFEKPNGDPYLEAHHVFRLSDEGLDDPDAVAAICPTCHRRIHHGKDGNEYNADLIEKLRAKQADA